VTMIDRDSLVSYGGRGIPYFVSGDVSELNQLRTTNFHAAMMDIINALANTAENIRAGRDRVIDVDQFAARFADRADYPLLSVLPDNNIYFALIFPKMGNMINAIRRDASPICVFWVCRAWRSLSKNILIAESRWMHGRRRSSVKTGEAPMT